jgi:hyperosmotically inducible protein
MKTLNLRSLPLALLIAGLLGGCSSTPTQSPAVTNQVRVSLDQSGLKDVSVSQDRDKGVVTLSGHVTTDGEKAQAETIARSIAGSQVVSNQIVVTPPGAGSDASNVNSDYDKGIKSNLDAALIKARMHKSVSYSVKSQVVTLTGTVDSETTRAAAQDVASGVPNVRQVVNELQVKGQKATESR